MVDSFQFSLESVSYEDLLREARALATSEMPGWDLDNKSDLGVFILKVYLKAVEHGINLSNAWAQEFNLLTARQRSSVISRARSLGYPVKSPQAATVNLVLDYAASGSPRSFLPYQFIASTQEKLVTDDVQFENAQAFTVAAAQVQSLVPFIAGQTKTDQVIGDGSEFQVVVLANKPVIDGSIKVQFGPDTWTQVDSLKSSASTAKHFEAGLLADERTYIMFGDNSTGARPPTITPGTITYRIGGGLKTNVVPGAVKRMLSTPGSIVVSAVTNPAKGSGGDDAESTGSIKAKAPFTYRNRRLLGQLTDVVLFAEQFAGVRRAYATLYNKNIFLSVIPVGGQIPSASLVQNLGDAVNELLVMGYFATVQPVSFVPATISVQFTTRPGFISAQVQSLVAESLRKLIDPLNVTQDEFGRDIFTRQFGDSLLLTQIHATMASHKDQIKDDYQILQPTSTVGVQDSQILTDIGSTITATSLNVQESGYLIP